MKRFFSQDKLIVTWGFEPLISLIPAGTQRCFKVDFLSRRWTTTSNFQRWNHVIDFNIGKITHFHRRFSVSFQRWNNVIFKRWNNVIFQRWNNVGFQRWNNIIFQRWNNITFQCWNVIFQRWNNVGFQRRNNVIFILTKSNVFSTLKYCFNFYLLAWKLKFTRPRCPW